MHRAGLGATSDTAGVWQVARGLYSEVGEEVSPCLGALARREVRRQRDRWQFETSSTGVVERGGGATRSWG